MLHRDSIISGIATTTVALLIIIAITLYFIRRLLMVNVDPKRAFVLVLGDLGRSPRMNYHCLSLAKLGYQVTFIGYKENKLLDDVNNNSNIKIVSLCVFPKVLQFGPKIIQYAVKTLFLSFFLLLTLVLQGKPPKFVLVQNPPSIPTLFIVYLYCKFVNTKFVIDWHNYGFSILALTNGPKHILVKICKWCEIFFGRLSNLNFCVTDAMKNDLQKTYDIKAITMHDKAHESFKSLSVKEKHAFFKKLVQKYEMKEFRDEKNENDTAFTQEINNSISMKANRPFLIVSSSSWTEDEDFNILIEALEIYQKEYQSKYPNLICALTGKGPLKEYYKKKFEEKSFSNINVLFLWLDPGDYPLLLGSADLGICLHKSSSNLDLPMKVVDMFGTRLPVLALSFPCISELVKANTNGLLFSNSNELAEHLKSILLDYSNENSKLNKFRENLNQFTSWTDEWNHSIVPSLNTL